MLDASTRAVAMVIALTACGSRGADAPLQEGTTEAHPAPPVAPEAPVQTDTEPLIEFVTNAQLYAPDGSDIVGVAVSMRAAPEGSVRDSSPPANVALDDGDGRGVLFGAEMIYGDDGSILSARTPAAAQRFSLSRRHLPAPVSVWLFDEADVVTVERLEPCTDCEPWQSPPARFMVVVPDATAGDAASVVAGWNIAIDA